MRRILCILDSLEAGGAETFLMKISRSLSKEEYQFDFIVSKGNGIYSQEVLERGGKIYVVPPRRKKLWKAFWNIRKIVKEEGYEWVLKLGDSPVVSLDLIAAKMGEAKKVGFRSCNALINLSKKERLINFFMRFVLNRIADVKLAPSKLAAEFTFGKNTCSDVHILNNGVDLQIFYFDKNGRKAIREELFLDDKLVVGHIGRFHEQKNHSFLLDVFYEIKKQRSDAVLLLVGVGELEQEIKRKAQKLELENNIIYAGIRFDITQLLSAMDVYVFPSLHEGMPNTVIEAQATGLPCVLADTITRDADITGLITYLSLSDSYEEWANTALEKAKIIRRDTSTEFRLKGYDIQSVSRKFIEYFEVL